jgi:hypothetical protein
VRKKKIFYLPNSLLIQLTISRMQDLTIDKFTEISQKAGGMIVLLPKTLVELTADQRDQILDLEK